MSSVHDGSHGFPQPRPHRSVAMIAWDETGPSRPSGVLRASSETPSRFAFIEASAFSPARLEQFRQVGFSMADQALAVGGMFLVNLALARTQTREEYGMFALAYSVLTFFLGLHNAAIVEPFTIYGSGRYRHRFPEYFQLMFWSNAAVGLLLTVLVLGVSLAFRWIVPQGLPRAILGLGLTASILLSGVLLRRMFYVQQQPGSAAAASLIFFVTASGALGLTARLQVLNSFSVFLVLAAGWLAAGFGLAGKLPFGKTQQSFLECEPDYWREHWKYARWVLVTAFVFQLTSQGYYWLVAGILSVKEVAELKAITLVVAPADQIFIALNYLALPRLSSYFAARRMVQLRSAWKRYALAVTAATLSFFLFIRAFGRPLTHLLYGGRYDDAAPLLTMLALTPVVMGIGHTMNAALKAAECPSLVFWAYAAGGTVTFLVGIPMVSRFGLRGAVCSMLLSGLSYTAALTVGFVVRFSRDELTPECVAEAVRPS